MSWHTSFLALAHPLVPHNPPNTCCCVLGTPASEFGSRGLAGEGEYMVNNDEDAHPTFLPAYYLCSPPSRHGVKPFLVGFDRGALAGLGFHLLFKGVACHCISHVWCPSLWVTFVSHSNPPICNTCCRASCRMIFYDPLYGRIFWHPFLCTPLADWPEPLPPTS